MEQTLHYTEDWLYRKWMEGFFTPISGVIEEQLKRDGKWRFIFLTWMCNGSHSIKITYYINIELKRTPSVVQFFDAKLVLGSRFLTSCLVSLGLWKTKKNAEKSVAPNVGVLKQLKSILMCGQDPIRISLICDSSKHKTWYWWRYHVCGKESISELIRCD